MLRPRHHLFFPPYTEASSAIQEMAENVSFPIAHRPRGCTVSHTLIMVFPWYPRNSITDRTVALRPILDIREGKLTGCGEERNIGGCAPSKGLPETTDEPYFQRLIKNSTETESSSGSLLSAGIGGRGCARLSVSKAARSSKTDPDERVILLDRTIPARFIWKVT